VRTTHSSWTGSSHLYIDELDDDALYDAEEEDITPDQQGLHASDILASVEAEFHQAQMSDGLDQVRLIIGTENDSGISDKSIKDVLWDSYFNLEETVRWALGWAKSLIHVSVIDYIIR